MIIGGGGITLNGTEMLTLTGVNTYSGATTLNDSSTLVGGAPNAFSPNSAVQINNSATLNLETFDQSIFTLSSSSQSAQVKLGGTLTLLGNVPTTYGGAITGSGGLNVDGTTIFTLSGSGLNTYSGPTTINGLIGGNAVTLQAGEADAFSPFSDMVITNTGVLDLNGFSQIIPSLSSASSAARVTLGRGTLTIMDSSSSMYNGSISGTGGLTVDLSSGMIFTLGATPSTYSGPTTVRSGRFFCEFRCDSEWLWYFGSKQPAPKHSLSLFFQLRCHGYSRKRDIDSHGPYGHVVCWINHM
jgi:autotransporter-associated beta strand protein